MGYRLWVIGLAALLTACCCKADSPRDARARGCDISWLSEMEADSVQFRDESGASRDCIELLRENGMNAVRLRVWVNHATGWSNLPDMLSLAKRAAAQGLRIMIDIHYSDFFADPHSQTIPEAWQNYDYDQLLTAVQAYTTEVLNALKQEGIQPEWVQIGNETPNGMLWPVGKLEGEQTKDEQWVHYAGLTTAGYTAAKEVFDHITVIVHVDNAYEYRDWFWNQLRAHGGKWDMIGLSHYPMMAAWSGKSWQEMNEFAETNVKKLIDEFDPPVMICEVGMMNYGQGALYEQVATLSDTVMTDFVQRMEQIDGCRGIFYWEPQVYGGWRPQEYIPLGWGGYDMGSFTPEGKLSPALKTLLKK